MHGEPSPTSLGVASQPNRSRSQQSPRAPMNRVSGTTGQWRRSPLLCPFHALTYGPAHCQSTRIVCMSWQGGKLRSHRPGDGNSYRRAGTCLGPVGGVGGADGSERAREQRREGERSNGLEGERVSLVRRRRRGGAGGECGDG